jgi:hypothetical protein
VGSSFWAWELPARALLAGEELSGGYIIVISIVMVISIHMGTSQALPTTATSSRSANWFLDLSYWAMLHFAHINLSN